MRANRWLLTVLFVGGLASVAQAEVVARHGACRLEQVGQQRVLVLQGSYREMGHAHGKLLAREVADNAEAFLDHWCLGGGREKLETLQKIWNAFEPFLPQRYKDELEGLAEGSGVPLAKLRLVHAIPERFHCTGAAAMGPATRDGKLYHTRSLDYALDIGNTRRVQENALLIVYQPTDGHAHAVVGWSGFIGCVTGMNAQGISIGEMGSQCEDEDFAGIPMIFLMREALRQAGTLHEALAVFRKGPRTCGYNFIIADGKIPDARAIEVTRSLMLEFAPGDPAENLGPHCALPHCVRRVNHFVGEATARTQRKEYDPRHDNPASIIGYELLTQWLREHHGKLDDRLLIRMLRLYPPQIPCLHQAVFCPTDLTLWVAHAADPRKTPWAGAQNQPFYRYNLRSLLAGEPADKDLLIDYKEPPRNGEPPVEKGTVTFRPVGDQSRIPERYRLEPHDFDYHLKLLHDFAGIDMEIWHLTFPSPVVSKYPVNNTVHAEYYRPKGKGPFPAVVVLDILGGDQTLSRLQATFLAQQGVAALFVQMPYYGPRRPANQPAARLVSPNLEHSLEAVRQCVLDVRRAGAWLEVRSEVDKDRLGIMGTSLGSFMGTLTAEMEPRFRRVAVLLGGGGLIEAFYDRPEAWPIRLAWQALGGSREKLAERLACADPLTCAENLKDRKLLLIGAKRDEIVPPSALERLWEATGRPRILWYDCTHEGAIVYVVPAMKEIIEHFREP